MASGTIEKKLSFFDCMGLCIGQIIGSGVMVLTGVIIGKTGHGAPWAFIAGACIAFMSMIPKALMVSALPFNGAKYVHVTKMLGRKTGFFYICCNFVSQVLIATFALGFASYFVSVSPQFNERVVAIGILIITVAINFVGLNTSALVQKIMVGLLLVSLLIFSAYGMSEVTWSNFAFTASNIMPNGLRSFCVGAALASFAAGGAGFVAENAGRVENPGKNIPKAMIISTIIVCTFYALVAIVASGVLPVELVAFQNLTLVAKEIFPPWLYMFFVVGGAWFALATTLNGTLAAVPRGLQAAAKDGWLPDFMAKENKHGVPTFLLCLFGILGAIPIVTGMNLAIIAAMGVGLDALSEVIYIVGCFQLHKKYPEEVAAAPFKIRNPKIMHGFLGVAAVVMMGATLVDLADLSLVNWICVIGYMIFAIILTQMRYKYVLVRHEENKVAK